MLGAEVPSGFQIQQRERAQEVRPSAPRRFTTPPNRDAYRLRGVAPIAGMPAVSLKLSGNSNEPSLSKTTENCLIFNMR